MDHLEIHDQQGLVEKLNRDITAVITIAMNKTIPKRVVHLRQETDMGNNEIEALKKKRDRLLKSARKSASSNDLSKVKELNKSIKKVIKMEREGSFYQFLIVLSLFLKSQA
jgi:hypothetical protein